MSATMWLRAASVISVLFAGGHTLGGQQAWSPIGETEVLTAMRSFHFTTEGVSRTYLDFYRGFGFLLSVFLVLQAVLLWQLAGFARTQPALVRPMVGTFLVASIASAILTAVFIFPLPVLFSAAVIVCLGFAFVTSR